MLIDDKYDMLSTQEVPPLLPALTSGRCQVQAPVTVVICRLCDKIADTLLIPCNHVVFCEEHAKLSKKCLECRVNYL